MFVIAKRSRLAKCFDIGRMIKGRPAEFQKCGYLYEVNKNGSLDAAVAMEMHFCYAF